MAYGLPANYISRTEPQYFNDTLADSWDWQADVYRAAAELARQTKAKRIVDIGCGRGHKLANLSHEFEIVGTDYGANIAACQQVYPQGRWFESDLNSYVIPARTFRNAVVICADVIEHLPNPAALIASLKNAASVAAYVLLSTPDRSRVYHRPQYGPPGNPWHCREWTRGELVAWLKSEGLPVRWSGWTISNAKRPDQVWTSLVILSAKHLSIELPAQYEAAQQWSFSL